MTGESPNYKLEIGGTMPDLGKPLIFTGQNDLINLQIRTKSEDPERVYVRSI